MRYARQDDGILNAALMGYEAQLREVEGKIADIRRRLGTKAAGEALSAPPAHKKHRISAEGRARIAAAQKRRWAAKKKAAAKA